MHAIYSSDDEDSDSDDEEDDEDDVADADTYDQYVGDHVKLPVGGTMLGVKVTGRKWQGQLQPNSGFKDI
jgi:hypothetical protein